MSTDPKSDSSNHVDETAYMTVTNWAERGFKLLPPIHPGHFLLCASAPFLLRAYRGYRTPLEKIVQDVLQSQNARVKIADLPAAEENVRRAVGSAVAGRALRVATSASVGVFGILSAAVFYATGCTTMEQAVVQTENWAQTGRQRLDNWFGIERVDRDHPEYKLVQSMTEEEEMEYLSKTYLPDEEWDTGLEEGEAQHAETPQNGPLQ